MEQDPRRLSSRRNGNESGRERAPICLLRARREASRRRSTPQLNRIPSEHRVHRSHIAPVVVLARRHPYQYGEEVVAFGDGGGALVDQAVGVGHLQVETKAFDAAEGMRAQVVGVHAHPLLIGEAVGDQLLQFVQAHAGAVPGAVGARLALAQHLEHVFVRLGLREDDQAVELQAIDGPQLLAARLDPRPVERAVQCHVEHGGCAFRLQLAAGAGRAGGEQSREHQQHKQSAVFEFIMASIPVSLRSV